MPQCAMVHCNNTHRKTKGGAIRYHRFPGDIETRARWVQACGRQVQNCATARVCSRHFSSESYERDVQHELLGLPSRCRLKKGAVPDVSLPADFLREDEDVHRHNSAIAVLLAVGLVPTVQPNGRANGGLPQDLNKMHVMEDVHEGCDAQPSSPGHAEQRNEMMQVCDDNCVPTNESEVRSQQSSAEKSLLIGGKTEDSSDNHTEIKLENTLPEKDGDEATHEKDANSANEDSGSSDGNEEPGSLKRKLKTSEECPKKKLQRELQRNFLIRDKFLNQYMESLGCTNLDQIQSNMEKLLVEVRTLNELAREKEKEWNNVIHLKKIKEELLLRLQRQKQLLLLNSDDFELQSEATFDFTDERRQNSVNCETTKQNVEMQKFNNVSLERQQFYERHENYNGKTTQYNLATSEADGLGDKQNKHRPKLNVKSIIADYRQRHPEAVPRRGRRIRPVLSQSENESSKVSGSGILNLSNIALGSGAQVRHNAGGMDINRELGLLLSSLDEGKTDSNSKSPGNDSLPANADPTSFKDMLVQFAKLSQNERQELLHHAGKPPPPYPEVTVHPMPATTLSNNSLLHGILTKSQTKPETKSTFSPTLARLLTAPEKVSATTLMNHSNMLQSGIVSISDILSSSKARNEITITPVGGQYDLPVKVKQVDEEEADDSVDRLVIDEGREAVDSRSKADNNSDVGDEVPQCQGCNQKPAQFVCAGCGNQWYCSRDCQVSAWDEHSEVCSG